MARANLENRSLRRELSSVTGSGSLPSLLQAQLAPKVTASCVCTPQVSYQIKVITSRKLGAGTDANIFIEIFGKTRTTGEVMLCSETERRGKFKSGSTDTFVLDLQDVGDEIEKIRIRHDNHGFDKKARNNLCELVPDKPNEENQNPRSLPHASVYKLTCGASSLPLRPHTSFTPRVQNQVKPSINVVKGDLTTQHTDVIVVCSSSGYLRTSVCRAGGSVVSGLYEAESKKTPPNPVISIAASGQLACRQVYFLPWQPSSDQATNQKSLQKFVADAISKPAKENYRSIAFPAVGCGQHGQSVSYIAHTMVEEARRQSLTTGMVVVFVIQAERTDIYDEFRKHMQCSAPKGKSVSAKVAKATIEVEEDDITKQEVDVIIASSTSGHLRTAIIGVAGSAVQTAFDRELAKNSRSLVIETPPGNLFCKRIFFLNWRPNADDKLLRQSLVDLISIVTHNMLSNNFHSVAFPAIGCGGHGCSVQIVVNTMVNEMKAQLRKRNLSWTVKFIIEAGQTTVYDEFCKQVLTTHDGIVIETFSRKVRSSYSFEIDNYLTQSYAIPSTWEKSDGERKRFVVSTSSPEYTSVIAQFNQSLQGQCQSIIRIERIQNKRWYMQYIAHSKDFHERLKIDTEKRLFHGCPDDAANAIINDCFNRRHAGENGVKYGYGAYFSSKASYSHAFAKPNLSGERCMFIVRVLIGKTIVGNESMKVQPVGYDSTTDGEHIFVTYHDAQALAEYLIIYK